VWTGDELLALGLLDRESPSDLATDERNQESGKAWRLTKLDHKDQGDEEGRDLTFDRHADKLADGLSISIRGHHAHHPATV
jgi:hypothetical protein